jgi:LacI family gluconate utilization system Gnt-I transcriptional repressor
MTRNGSRSTGRPTLNEVAQLAAVSPITASRALRGVATVAPELVEKVRAAALSLGYVANPAARALASSQSQTVVVLVPSLSNQLFIETLEAIQAVLRPRGLEVVIGNYHYSPQEEENLLRSHLANRPRGMLLTGFDRSPAAQQLLAASGVPCVHMMELDAQRAEACVGFSQQQAGAAASAQSRTSASGVHRGSAGPARIATGYRISCGAGGSGRLRSNVAGVDAAAVFNRSGRGVVCPVA